MKLRNKKTGEIKEYGSVGATTFGEGGALEAFAVYNSLAELNEEWEDYEEHKDHWHIGCEGDVFIDNTERSLKSYFLIGNDFETKEEAELAVRKLKAWKRLKDKGFRFNGWTIDDGLRISICTNTNEDDIYDEDKRRIKPDLDIIFEEKDE